MADPVAEFAALLADLKKRSGRSYAALARRCGDVSGSTLHRYCRGEGVPPDFAVAERIARACAATPAQLAELRRRWILADYHWRSTQASPDASPDAPDKEPAPTEEAVPRPRQLPAAAPHFAGRERELAELTRFAGEVDAPGTVVVSAIGGTAGIGKTTLAVHWAHRAADWFPDGQLYVDLRGFDPSGDAMPPGDAVRGFLEAFGVNPQQVPAGLDAQVGLYRSLLAGRRVLIVLDNARDSAQVRPLLPGSPGCLVLVTSRSRLDSLVAAEGAHPLTLDVLSAAEARQVLAGRLSPERVAAEPVAVRDIIDRCARLPLALSIVAARAAAHTAFPLAALLDELRESGGGLDALSGGDPTTDVRAVLSWSYGTLNPAAARLFRLLGLHAGPDLTVAAAASLAGLPVRDTRRLLGELTRAHLIAEPVPGRYAFHDLLRAYAAEQAEATDPPQERVAATQRGLDHYLHSGHSAVTVMHPSAQPVAPDPCRPGVTLADLPDAAAALRWFATEHAVLLRSVEYAGTHGFDRQCWQLAAVLITFLDRRGHWHDFVHAAELGLGAARRTGDTAAEARANRSLGLAHARLGRTEPAHAALAQAIRLFAALGDQVGQAYSHLNDAFVYDRAEQPADALHAAELAADLFRASGNRTGQAQALNTVGWHHAQLGEYHRALRHCREALALLQDLGHRNGEADTWDSLGYAHAHLGQYVEALVCYRQALAIYRSIGDRHKEANTLDSLADTHHAAGEPEVARTAWQEALTILDDLAHPTAARIRAKLAAIGRR